MRKFAVPGAVAQSGESSFIHIGRFVTQELVPHAAQSLIVAGASRSITPKPLVFEAVRPAGEWIHARPKVAAPREQHRSGLVVLGEEKFDTVMTRQAAGSFARDSARDSARD